MSDSIVNAFDPFTELVRTRAKHVAGRQWQYVQSEEAFRFDYAIALGRVTSSAVFPEFPYDKDRNQKADLFLDEDAGYFIEAKYFRPIPSGQTTPLTQHLGSLVADFLKLRLLTRPNRGRYQLVVAEGKFRDYLGRSPLGRILERDIAVEVTPSQLPRTARNEIGRRLPRIGEVSGTAVRARGVRTAMIGESAIALVHVE